MGINSIKDSGRNPEIKQITWEVRCISAPAARKYCKKCGGKTDFVSSGQFRVNAQKKSLDIWLIYRCAACKTSWNAEVFSRISPQRMPDGMLERFTRNDETLAEQYAMDCDFLRRNGAEPRPPSYDVTGEEFPLEEQVELTIRSPQALPVKISAIIREKLKLSQRMFSDLASEGKIRSAPERDLNKCRLNHGLTVVFNQKAAAGK